MWNILDIWYFYNIWDFCIWKVRIKFRDMYVLTNDNPYFASYIKFNNLCQYYQPPNVIFFYFSKNSRGFLRFLILSSVILIQVTCKSLPHYSKESSWDNQGTTREPLDDRWFWDNWGTISWTVEVWHAYMIVETLKDC